MQDSRRGYPVLINTVLHESIRSWNNGGGGASACVIPESTDQSATLSKTHNQQLEYSPRNSSPPAITPNSWRKNVCVSGPGSVNGAKKKKILYNSFHIKTIQVQEVAQPIRTITFCQSCVFVKAVNSLLEGLQWGTLSGGDGFFFDPRFKMANFSEKLQLPLHQVKCWARQWCR